MAWANLDHGHELTAPRHPVPHLSLLFFSVSSHAFFLLVSHSFGYWLDATAPLSHDMPAAVPALYSLFHLYAGKEETAAAGTSLEQKPWYLFYLGLAVLDSIPTLE